MFQMLRLFWICLRNKKTFKKVPSEREKTRRYFWINIQIFENCATCDWHYKKIKILILSLYLWMQGFFLIFRYFVIRYWVRDSTALYRLSWRLVEVLGLQHFTTSTRTLTKFNLLPKHFKWTSRIQRSGWRVNFRFDDE